MSAVVHHDYAPTAETSARIRSLSWSAKRLIVAAAGCAVMALSGSGLANYLDTSSATGPDASAAGQADAATLN